MLAGVSTRRLVALRAGAAGVVRRALSAGGRTMHGGCAPSCSPERGERIDSGSAQPHLEVEMRTRSMSALRRRARPCEPASTRWPTRTETRERCAYIERTRSQWATVTSSPQPPGRRPAQTTRPGSGGDDRRAPGRGEVDSRVEAFAPGTEEISERGSQRQARAGSARRRGGDLNAASVAGPAEAVDGETRPALEASDRSGGVRPEPAVEHAEREATPRRAGTGARTRPSRRRRRRDTGAERGPAEATESGARYLGIDDAVDGNARTALEPADRVRSLRAGDAVDVTAVELTCVKRDLQRGDGRLAGRLR